jgi:hypothetical protein
MLEIERLKAEGQNKSANATPKQTKQKSSAKKARDPSPSEMSVKSCKSNKSMKSFSGCKSFKSTPVVPATSTELAEAQELEDEMNYLAEIEKALGQSESEEESVKQQVDVVDKSIRTVNQNPVTDDG